MESGSKVLCSLGAQMLKYRRAGIPPTMSEHRIFTTLGEAEANHNFASSQYLAQSDASLRALSDDARMHRNVTGCAIEGRGGPPTFQKACRGRIDDIHSPPRQPASKMIDLRNCIAFPGRGTCQKRASMSGGRSAFRPEFLRAESRQ
jgi:hypothetical protein